EAWAQSPPKHAQTLVGRLEDSLRGSLDGLWKEYADLLGADELPPFEKFSQVREKLARSRVKPMRGLVEQFEEQGEPLVVFSAHRAPVEALAGRPGWAVITGDTDPQARQAAVSAFQAGELRGLGLTIQAGGTGVTLTRAAGVVFVGLGGTPARS